MNSSKKRYTYTQEDLEKALQTLIAGGLILYPTDTIWGIGCDATNPTAVNKVFSLKQRCDSKALISIIPSFTELEYLMPKVPEMAQKLISFATQPLTIIYPNVQGLASNLLAEDGSAGIRVCDEPFCKELSERLKKPIVSTSANISGQPTAPCYGEVSESIVKGVDYVVRYRQEDTHFGQPSRIIKLELDGIFTIIR